MSLKSFDKFCERMIMGNPESQKDILDERQNQIRAKVTLESFQLFAVLTSVGLFVYELYPYLEGPVLVAVLAAALCYLWWTLRNIRLESLLGIKYASTKYVAMMVEMVILGVTLIPEEIENLDERENFFIVNGGLSINSVMIVSMAIMIIASIITLVAVSRRKKQDNSTED